MNASIRRIPRRATALAAWLALGAAWSQTPAQMEYDRQQREYWRAQEQQRQEQQRQQQIMDENARRQQQESADAARRSQETSRQFNEQFNQDMNAAQARQQQALRNSQAEGAKWEAARQAWLKQPALAPDRNPLLGRWTRPARAGNPNDPFAGLAALAKGGLCEVLFGGGVFEFRPSTLVGMEPRGSNIQELDRVEYRGDAKQVAVIPKTTLRLMVWDFDGPDRISWQGQNCVMVRVKAAPEMAAGASPARQAATEARPGAAAAKAAGVMLGVVAGLGSGPTFAPLSGASFLVLRHSADDVLAGAGFRSRPGTGAIKAWADECRRRAPGCQQGAAGLRADALGMLRTDAQGRAQTPPLAAGTYFLFGSGRRPDHGEAFWNLRVELKPGAREVTLDQRNMLASD